MQSGFSFTSLEEIVDMVQSRTLDVIGVIFDVGPVVQIQTRDGQQRDKRNLVIGDESHFSINVTLWGDVCVCQYFEIGQVVALQNARVVDYNGKSLSGSSNPKDININSSHNRFTKLKNWVS